MYWINIGMIVLVLVLAGIYFMPYRQLRGKIFKRLLPDTAGITAMEYRTSAYSLQLEKRDNTWYLIDSDWEADPQKVRKLLSRLRDLVVDERISAGHDDPDYDIGSNGYLILDYSGNVTTIAIGNRLQEDEEFVYITKTGDPDILVVHSSALSLLPKDATSFSDTLLFEAYYPQVKSVEASYKKKDFSLIKTEDGWKFDGITSVKDEIAQEFIQDIISTEASGFVEDENIKIPPRPEATITLKIGNRGVTRYLFEVSGIDKYIMPLRGRILYVEKDIVKKIFSFKGKKSI